MVVRPVMVAMLAMCVMVSVFGMDFAMQARIGYRMLVDVEQPDHKEHGQKANQHPGYRFIE